MVESAPSERLRQKLELKKYLKELSALTGRPVGIDELGSLEQAASIREAGQRKFAGRPRAFEIPFSDKRLERFGVFVRNLRDANPTSIYVWTPRTITCGALLVPSLDAVKFDFDFAINDEGILVLLSSDIQDKLLLDFSELPAGDVTMKIETQGPNWATVVY